MVACMVTTNAASAEYAAATASFAFSSSVRDRCRSSAAVTGAEASSDNTVASSRAAIRSGFSLSACQAWLASAQLLTAERMPSRSSASTAVRKACACSLIVEESGAGSSVLVLALSEVAAELASDATSDSGTELESGCGSLADSDTELTSLEAGISSASTVAGISDIHIRKARSKAVKRCLNLYFFIISSIKTGACHKADAQR